MRTMTRQEAAPDYYWPQEPDDDRLASTLTERCRQYFDRLKENRYLEAMLRSWRFYHGMQFASERSSFKSGVRFMGEEGEYIGLPDNLFRSLLQGILTVVTENRPNFRAIAVNSDHTSLEQARLGTDILNYYFREKRVEEKVRRAVETSLVLFSGFVKVCWDPMAGRPTSGMDGQFAYEGDLKIEAKTPLDIAYDLTAQSWDEVKKSWLMVRGFENKWDLAAQYPELAEELVTRGMDKSNRYDSEYLDFSQELNQYAETDRLEIWDFYHARTPSMPAGSHIRICDNLILERQELDYEDIPVYRCSPGNTVMTSLGYSPAIDLIGLQQALNQEMSTIASNHKQFGMPVIWTKPDSGAQVSQLKDAFNLVECDEKPEPLELLGTPAELFKFPEMLNASMQRQTGINNVTLGQPEASLKSGSALALIDSKAAQMNSGLQYSMTALLEDVGQCMLRTLRRYASSPRILTIVGLRNRQYQREFSGEDLGSIDRVQVQVGSHLTSTASGKLELANNLLQNNKLSTPEEYLTVATTGNLEPLYQAEHAQLSLIHDENERLLNGENVQADIADNHVLHVREHMAQIATVDMRANIPVATNIRAHCFTHLQMIADPEAMIWGAALGYQEMLALAPMFQPMAQGQGQPGTETPGGSQPGDTNTPGEAQDQSSTGDTTPREPQEPAGSPSMPNMPAVPRVQR